MVAVDAGGTPVRVSGAALAGGPLLAIASRRQISPSRASGAAAGSFPAAIRGAVNALSHPASGSELAAQDDALPVRWGIPTFFAGAPFGPPYELENRAAEWLLGADTGLTFFGSDRQARMALRVHPRGPALQTGGTFLAALYGAAPAPRSLGVGVDALG
ncbi:MAG TPA: hypothetical protein VFX49_11485 [Chloroflexota bacterium]|nr:hypothetical protein [Chloroflexota bacterium]